MAMVYVVTAGERDEEKAVGVFSTQENAIRYGGAIGGRELLVFEIDAELSQNVLDGKKSYCVEVYESGFVRLSKIEPKLTHTVYVFNSIFDRLVLRFFCWATDKQDAEHQAYQARLRIMSDGNWREGYTEE